MTTLSNLSRFDTKPRANEGVWFNLKDPTDGGVNLENGKDKPIRFLTHGTDSDRFIKANNAKRADEMSDARKNVKFSQSLADQRVRALVAAGVSGWENIPKCWVEGEGTDESAVEFTYENCVKLFTNLPWVQEQIDVQISDRKNYFGDSSTN